MSDAVDTNAAPRARPASNALIFCAAVSIGIVCALAGFATPLTLVYMGMGGGLAGVVVGILLVLSVLGLIVGGIDFLITGQRGAAVRAVLVVVAVALIVAAEITIDMKATGGHPTGWWTLAPLAGATGFGTSLLVTRRLAPTIVGVIVLVIVGAMIVGLVQQATADNGYPMYNGLALS
jgi:hypothetical protein